jgi:hypothetical protein
MQASLVGRSTAELLNEYRASTGPLWSVQRPNADYAPGRAALGMAALREDCAATNEEDPTVVGHGRRQALTRVVGAFSCPKHRRLVVSAIEGGTAPPIRPLLQRCREALAAKSASQFAPSPLPVPQAPRIRPERSRARAISDACRKGLAK